jgi:hypothetical protein
MALHTSLDKHLEKLKDPRRDLRKRYPLKTLVILTVMAGISGADDWVAVERCWIRKRFDNASGNGRKDCWTRG